MPGACRIQNSTWESKTLPAAQARPPALQLCPGVRIFAALEDGRCGCEGFSCDDVSPLTPAVQDQQSDARWDAAMETAALKRKMWRKSSQWASLLRRHAEVSTCLGSAASTSQNSIQSTGSRAGFAQRAALLAKNPAESVCWLAQCMLRWFPITQRTAVASQTYPLAREQPSSDQPTHTVTCANSVVCCVCCSGCCCCFVFLLASAGFSAPATLDLVRLPLEPYSRLSAEIRLHRAPLLLVLLPRFLVCGVSFRGFAFRTAQLLVADTAVWDAITPLCAAPRLRPGTAATCVVQRSRAEIFPFCRNLGFQKRL